MADAMTQVPGVVGYGVLRDYPLRLWQRQQEHTDGVLREFSLLVGGVESGTTSASPPAQLLELATLFTQQFGALINELNEARSAAVAAGQDRMDSRVPLIEGLPAILQHIDEVLRAVDEYCNEGELLTLARPPELVALSDWTMSELAKQYDGGEPTPWPGPF
jgi:hypothetical protein